MTVPVRTEVTQLLQAYGTGDREALDRLLPILYQELYGIARARLRGERMDHTLGPTALVNEAYLKLVDIHQVDWQNRGHFLAMASKVMRRILVDHAVKKKAAKRGGNQVKVEISDDLLVKDEDLDTVLALNDSLERLEADHERPAQVLEHCYFGGLINEEIGVALKISLATVERDLRFARAWLASDWKPDE